MMCYAATSEHRAWKFIIEKMTYIYQREVAEEFRKKKRYNSFSILSSHLLLQHIHV